jgi:hypothetical protein
MTKVIGPNDIVAPAYNAGWGHSAIRDPASTAPEKQPETLGGVVDSQFGFARDIVFELAETVYSTQIDDETITINIPDDDGPFKSAFEASTEGVIRQELVTYRMRNGLMIKEVNTRKYTPDDYIDSKDVIPLGEVIPK